MFKEKLINFSKSFEFKWIMLSIFISLILFIIICKTLILDYGGHLTFFEQSINTFNNHNSFSTASVYHPEKSYYVYQFPKMLYYKQNYMLFSGILFGLFGLGLIIYIVKFIRNWDYLKSEKHNFKTLMFEKLLLILAVLMIIVAFIGFKQFSNHMIFNISFLIFLTILFGVLKKFPGDKNNLSLDFVFFAYFVINFIFISTYSIKQPRYLLPVIPPLIYLIIWGLNSIVNFISNKFSNSSLDYRNSEETLNRKVIFISKIIPICIILIFMISTISFIAPMEFNRTNDVYQEVLYEGFSTDLEDACEYIKNNDSDYHTKTFSSYYHQSRTIRWYLNVNDTILDENSDLDNYDGTDYIIINENKTFNNYHKLYHFGDFTVYYHN